MYLLKLVMFIGDYKKFVFNSEIYNIPLFNKEGFFDLFKKKIIKKLICQNL